MMAKNRKSAAPELPITADVADLPTEYCSTLKKIEVPILDVVRPGVHSPMHVQARLKTRQQKEALRRLYDGLDAAGARLTSGHRVASFPDAIRWLLEQLG